MHHPAGYSRAAHTRTLAARRTESVDFQDPFRQRPGVFTWREFEEEQPELAEAGRSLLYQFGTVGLGFLATVAKDGSPRTHPMCPLVTDDKLLAFIEPGPKRQDLHRDGRYALHCFPPAANEDAAYFTGRASFVGDDRPLVEHATVQWLRERALDEAPPGLAEEELFELRLDRFLLTRTTGHGRLEPEAHGLARRPRHHSRRRVSATRLQR